MEDSKQIANIHVRLAAAPDCDRIAAMCAALWPDATAEEHRQEVAAKLAGEATSTLPIAILVAERPDHHLCGFLEVGLRSHADGCDTRNPVGFLEGWFVDADARRQGVGRALVAAAEQWARARGCVEMASDTWLDDDISQHAHQALGYEVVDRCVHYRKSL